MTTCVDDLNVIVRPVIPPDIGEDVFAPPELSAHPGSEVLHQRVTDLRDDPLQFGKVFFVNLKHRKLFVHQKPTGNQISRRTIFVMPGTWSRMNLMQRRLTHRKQLDALLPIHHRLIG